MKNITIPLGITAGILLSVVMLAPLDTPTMETINDASTGYLEMFLASFGAIAAMFIIVRKNPEIKFSQLIKYGVITSAITALIFYMANVIYFSSINTEYLGNFFDLMTEKRVAGIADATKKAEHLAQAAKDKNMYTRPYLYSIFPTLFTFMFSLMPIAVFGYILFRIRRFQQMKKTVK